MITFALVLNNCSDGGKTKVRHKDGLEYTDTLVFLQTVPGSEPMREGQDHRVGGDFFINP